MNVYSHSFWAMNTRFIMVLPSIDNTRGAELALGTERIVETWEHCLSRFRNTSELSHINAKAFNSDTRVSNQMEQALKACAQYVNQTQGLFDPAFSPVYDLMRTKTAAKNELENLANKCGWQYINWNEQTKQIRYLTKEVQLDFGGIGKGIALKEVVSYLRNEGINSALLSFGESSIAGIGRHPHGSHWPITQVSTSSIADNQKVFELEDENLSVSGLQMQEAQMHQAHIYHPLKQQLMRKSGNTAVKSHCPIEAEVLSTALYLANNKQTQILKKQFPDALWHTQTGIQNN